MFLFEKSKTYICIYRPDRAHCTEFQCIPSASNEIDLYPEYTGTGLLSILQLDLITDPEEVYNTVKQYEEKVQLTWLDYAQANPDIAEALNKLSAALDTATITQLNAKVDVDNEEYEDVAKEFYQSIQ